MPSAARTDPTPNDSITGHDERGPIALLGYSIETMEAAARLGRDFVAVVPPGFDEGLIADGVRAIPWKFEKINEHSDELRQQLDELGVQLAVPLYEETVEWAGALNAHFRNDPRVFNRYLLFRDKAMMKRKAQMSGIRVGVFEEVDSHDAARRFFRRVNEALLRIEGDVSEPVHVKPISAAGSVGHRFIRTEKDIDDLPDDAFPLLAESHLDGQEFSVEAFVHEGQIRFMNITEYVHLGYSQIIPPGPVLEEMREKIRRAIQKLIKAFDIRYGMIHPEYFVDSEGELNFGEVAARVPGGHIFELMERAYGFNPFEAMLLCWDPKTSVEELEAFFPDEKSARGHAGNLMIYPRKERVESLDVPESLTSDPFFEKHDMFEPITQKVAERVGFGNHYGKISFFGDDPERLCELLLKYEEYDFYT